MSFEPQRGSPRHFIETVTGRNMSVNPIIRPKHRNHYSLLQTVEHGICTINQQLGKFAKLAAMDMITK